MGKVIGVLSLKGGVGKTSSVIGLGAALASYGKKVLLIDANFSAPNLGIHLDILEPKKTIHHILADGEDFSEAVVEIDNFYVIPASVFPHKIIDPLKLKDFVEKVKENYDFVLIDSSPALNKETLAAMISSDELFVISTPDYSTLSMSLKAIKVAKKQGSPITGLILNKVYGKNFELSLEDVEKTSEVPVLAMIPHDVNVLKSQSQFIPAPNFRPKSDVSIEFMKLAGCLVGEKYDAPFRIKDLFKGPEPRKQDINRDLFYQSVFS
jgi:MinD-like ATPase involved in chromosome partitioning or flagellar assembly